MPLRIEEKTLTATPTEDPLIYRVDADVTKDGPEILTPRMYHVSVLWNTTTPRTNLREAMRLAIKESTVQYDLRAAIGEAILPAQPAPGPEPAQNIIINAASVTVNQAPGGA